MLPYIMYGNIATILNSIIMLKSIPIYELSKTLQDGMRHYGYSESLINGYVKGILHLYEYMDTNNLEVYDESVGDKYYSTVLNDGNISIYRKTIDRRSILLLNHILSGKPYDRTCGQRRVTHTPPNTELGKYVNDYLRVIDEQGYSYATRITYRRNLSFFAKAMNASDISLGEIDHTKIIEYIGGLQKGRIHMALCLRRFLSYLYGQKVIDTDLSLGLYGIKEFRSQSVLTFYYPSEVKLIEEAVDRSTKKGKQDYAIILLATRLGLRASDIRHLKFSNLDWEKNEIRLTQYKTGRKITLPLLAEVGEALIDYIKNSRPIAINIKEIFVTNSRPYRPYQNIGGITAKYIKMANIEVNGRHRGLHSLRHSLATALMNEGNSIHVISRVLGHRSSDSTMRYLGVDLKGLLLCSHEVTKPSEKFYTQRGGIFYE